MKKIMSILLLLVLASTAMAVSIARVSIRAMDGTVDYISGDSTFDFSKLSFSAYFKEGYSENNRDQGQAKLQITAITLDGDKIKLNLHMKLKDVIENTDARLYVDNTARGTYWKIGQHPLRVNLGTVRYDYDKTTGLVNIAGEGDIDFRVTGMEVVSAK